MANKAGSMKYFKLKEDLKNDILSGIYKPGDRMPSENQLARELSISRHTVRKALSILEEEGYIVAYHGKGTFCTERAIHKKQSRNIAVITNYISDYIFPQVLNGINQVLTENGYSLMFKTTGNSRVNETKCLEDILTKDVDGLIIEPSKSELFCKHPNLYKTLDKYEIPYVFIQGVYAEMSDKPYIVMDDCRGGYLLTKYLIDTGHRFITGIFKADDYQGKERHRGYVKALNEAGIPYNPDAVVWFHTEDRASKPRGEIRRMTKEGFSMDAVVCYNDQIALEVIYELEALGISIPEDISVTGYDNSALAKLGVLKLTTIAHPQKKLGEMAGQLLLEQIQGVPAERSRVTRVIEPELIVRNSCRDRRKTEEKR